VLGAGGAVGQVAVAAARLLGAAEVVAVARSAEARQRARAAGASTVVEMAGDPAVLAARLAEASGGPFDVVVDPVFGAGATAAARLLAGGGRLVNLGGAAGDAATLSSAALRSRSAEVLGYTNNALTPEQRAEAVTAVLGHAAAGRLAVAHEVLPLAGVTDAWERLRDGRAATRLVLTP
jgi:NADPH:quinone reductase-like Zn-dependent oxidoreductase